MNIKKYHIIIGLILALFGLICTGLSVATYFKPEIPVDIEAMKTQAALNCQQQGITLGFSVKKDKDLLVFTPKNPSIDDPRPDIYKSSILIERCEKMLVNYFCMGEECENPVILKMTTFK